jgi:hypothetical protein
MVVSMRGVHIEKRQKETRMSRNYLRPDDIRAMVPDLDHWASSRETCAAVACAIHAIADDVRSADAIWDDPTVAEIDHVKMAVEEYVTHGDSPAEPDGRYPWGTEAIVFSA